MAPKDIVDARDTFVNTLVHDGTAPSLTGEKATAFVRHLLKTVNICTRHNVQLCSSFIVKYLAPSTARVAALGDYLAALSLDCEPEKPSRLTPNLIYRQIDRDTYEGLDMSNPQRVLCRPMPAFRRLHILYILHDVLLRLTRTSQPISQVENMQAGRGALVIPSMLRDLTPHAIRHVHYVACSGYCTADQAANPLRKVLAEWKRINILPGVEDLEETVDSHSSRKLSDAESSFQLGQEKQIKRMKRAHIDANKWHLPQRHGVKGDPDPSWVNLPAANGLYMRRTRGFPMKYMAFPQGGYVLKNGGKPTSEDLKKEVSWLYKEAMHAFDKHPDPNEVKDIDPLGNIVWKDPDRPTRNHWGRTHEGVKRQKLIEERCKEDQIGYANVPPPPKGPPSAAVSDALARARALANSAARGRDAQSRGGYPPRRSGFDDRDRDRGYGDRARGYGDRDRGYNDRGYDDRGYGGRGGYRGRGGGGWGGGGGGGGYRGGGRGGGYRGGRGRPY